MTLEKLVSVAESIDKMSDGFDEMRISVKDFEEIERAIELCKSLDGDVFEPNFSTPFEWCVFKLGSVTVDIVGKRMSEKEIAKYYLEKND